MNSSNGLFLPEGQPLTFYFDELEPEGSINIPFYFMTNKRFSMSRFIIKLKITEEFGAFNKDFDLNFYLNRKIALSSNKWYSAPRTEMSCNEVCANHGGFDASGSQHEGNDMGMFFYPDKKDDSYNWKSIECSSTDNNTNWGANGEFPDGNWKFQDCLVHCKCYGL